MYDFSQTPGFVFLKACGGSEDIAAPVSAPTSSCGNVLCVNHKTHLPTPLSRIRHCSIRPSCKCNLVLECGRTGASLEKCHFPVKMVQVGAGMANGMHAVPPPRISSDSLIVHDICTCFVWLGLARGCAWGRRSKLEKQVWGLQRWGQL